MNWLKILQSLTKSTQPLTSMVETNAPQVPAPYASPELHKPLWRGGLFSEYHGGWIDVYEPGVGVMIKAEESHSKTRTEHFAKVICMSCKMDGKEMSGRTVSELTMADFMAIVDKFSLSKRK